MPRDLLKLTAQELDHLPRTSTVFFFPVGGIEDHGPHLPMGMDLGEAEKLCRMAAEKVERDLPGWVAVLMPPAPLGISGNTTALTVLVRAHVLRDWLVDSAKSLIRQDFRHFVCFSGSMTPKQLTAIEDAGKIINRKGFWSRLLARVGGSSSRVSFVSACSAMVSPEETKRSLFWAHPSEHGGKRDTSVALFLNSGEVGSDFSKLAAVPAGGPSLGFGWKRLRWEVSGYWGKPSEASAAQGEKELSGTIREVFPKLQAVWEGSNPNFIFRSWYSIIPWNKSFFKAWLLSFALFLILAAWSILWFQAATGN